MLARMIPLEPWLPRVRSYAYHFARRLPKHVDVDDLIGAAHEGLLKAAARYEPAWGPFRPFAYAVVHGAMLDELRATDYLTRYGRTRANQIAKTKRLLLLELNRPPYDDEVAARMGLPLGEYQRTDNEVQRRVIAEEHEVHADEPLADAELAARELKRNLAAAISRLPERTQRVLALYYWEGMKQAPIAAILGLTESRVCQILGETMAKLRVSLAA
jgi:RNA polymerase sigma factor for flagellar operon FliA